MEFKKFDKIPRLSRYCIITEKIDGTNAQIYIVNKETYLKENYNPDNPDMTRTSIDLAKEYNLYDHNKFYIYAGSRRKWLDISSKGDNFGFAKWVQANAEELLKLGEGRHYGEWWGKGIQRGYNMQEKVFSLFNTYRWAEYGSQLKEYKSQDPKQESKFQLYAPKCCRVVPVLWEGEFDTDAVTDFIEALRANGSDCAPGYMNAEGVIVYHTASNQLFKMTLLNDEKPKELVKNEI